MTSLRRTPPKLIESVLRPRRNNNNKWPKTRRPLLQLFLCFFLGFIFGLNPFNFPYDQNINNINNVETLHLGASIKPLRSSSNNNNAPAPPVNIILETLHLGANIKTLAVEKLVIIVTPTYNRVLQGYFLRRVSQVLRLVRQPLLWLVVEYGVESNETAEILRRSGVMYRHLVCKKTSKEVKDRGVHQRNTALEHIGRHRLDGIVYFADDDNVYTVELFESLREIRRFGTWPVAMLAQSKNKAILEGPVCNGSQVIGWHTNEKSKRLRRFHVDMSGFAFNSTIIWDPKRWHRPTSNPLQQLDTVKEGFQETTFIEQVVEDENQMEGIPYKCSRVMNWHLHFESHNRVYPSGWFLPKNLEANLPLK